MDATRAAAEFVNAAAAWGECHDAGRSDQADILFPKLEIACEQLRGADLNAVGTLETLMRTHVNPWVRYCAAAAVARTAPGTALPVLEQLACEDGLWAVNSKLAVFYLKSVKN